MITADPVVPLIDELIEIAGDYRPYDPERRMTRERAKRWLAQFPADERHDVLSETVHLLGRSYISRATAGNLLARFLRTYVFGGSTVFRQWQLELARTRWAVTQPKSSSQYDLLRLLDEVLRTRFKGLSRVRADSRFTRYVLLDDALFTGNTAIHGLLAEHRGRRVIDLTPPDAEIWVVVLAYYQQGWEYVKRQLAPFLGDRRLQINHHLCLGDRFGSANDVLWPTESAVRATTDPAVEAYVAEQQAALQQKFPTRSVLRTGAAAASAGGFTSLARRELLEARFLQAGVRIRADTAHAVHGNDRPLGFEKLIGLGFGTPLITYRNAPNNAPLVLHRGAYALFPRRIRSLRS